MVKPKDEYLKTLYELCKALLKLQMTDPSSTHYGAIFDPACGVFHTRAGEAVFPFAVAWKHSRRQEFLEAAISLGNWLVLQQQPEGFWFETPDTWTGTTTDQLLMLSCTYPLLEGELDRQQREAWQYSIRKAADYLVEVMNQDFAHINYSATTGASLAAAYRIVPNKRYLDKARELARLVMAKLNTEGFLEGEGDKIKGIQYGVDLGYNVDMSLWGLALYAKLVGDESAWQVTRQALRTHLSFLYPNGALDNSWGTRSYKWTVYGSKTADGCQALFSLFAGENPIYRTAGLRNLAYLRSCVRNGLVGCGPWYWEIYEGPPCIYPTFARAKNLALALEFGDVSEGPLPPLPSDKAGWFRHFHSVDVVLVRTKGLMATVTAYGQGMLGRSKYSNHPTGGSISALWGEDYDWLQLSSQSRYERQESVHMPRISKPLKPLTPRIEFRNGNAWCTNLHEFDGHIWAEQGEGSCVAMVSTCGELKDADHMPCGIAYTWTHRFFDYAVEKEVILRYHGKARPAVQIVEPVVWRPGLHLEQVAPGEIRVNGGSKLVKLTLEEGPAQLKLGKDPELYEWPFPAARSVPITIEIIPPSQPGHRIIRYRLTLET